MLSNELQVRQKKYLKKNNFFPQLANLKKHNCVDSLLKKLEEMELNNATLASKLLEQTKRPYQVEASAPPIELTRHDPINEINSIGKTKVQYPRSAPFEVINTSTAIDSNGYVVLGCIYKRNATAAFNKMTNKIMVYRPNGSLMSCVASEYIQNVNEHSIGIFDKTIVFVYTDHDDNSVLKITTFDLNLQPLTSHKHVCTLPFTVDLLYNPIDYFNGQLFVKVCSSLDEDHDTYTYSICALDTADVLDKTKRYLTRAAITNFDDPDLLYRVKVNDKKIVYYVIGDDDLKTFYVRCLQTTHTLHRFELRVNGY
jgi:hypothetical protein